ncbi:unconventional myosin-VI-like [Tetranychus urticae]|uniref:Uncharacterized protein n=1 Tax=Tetranychus urticae TaxID=32264 RepID=T1L1B7_TETUR|nr:unconventional myosin-VI-like [Tetranychus urticae]XP_015792689.1 unconventional myosin-VI-like [Tetranychus urticae]
MESQKVWAPDPDNGYILGTIIDIGFELATVKCANSNQTIKAPYSSLYPADPEIEKHVDDNCALMFLNEATLLNNLRVRYERDLIYTYVANILISINPYFEIRNLYSSEAISRYQGKSLGVLPPHVFAIADKAFRDMKAFKQSQSIIVSGESGAGKTEATKYVLRYLCESWGTNSGQIERLILDANPVLEAFGNAKTVRNNNSSRFGKFIEIHFSGQFSVVGGFISHYLLEKSRICGQSSGERNYHIFYQLCAGSPKEIWSQLKLDNPDQFHYLNRGCTQYFGSKSSASLPAERQSREQASKGSLNDPIVDDAVDFTATDKALSHFGVNDRLAIYKVVASVLHLGNIAFEESPDDTRGGCQVKTGSSWTSLETAASLIGIEAEELQQCLLSRIMQTNKGGHKGTVYLVPLKVHEASAARDALAKALYSKLFDHLVTQVINRSIPTFQSSYYVGVLDIAGFEYFRHNSFEQFCINYCNEKLQQVFNERILREEQILYEKEGLGLKHIAYIDNSDCINLLEGRATGIFDLLDEESKLPKPSATHFTESVFAHNKDHFRLAVPRKSKLKDDRELRDDEGFLIRHFAGAVCYQTGLFIEKNADALHNSLASLMSEAKNDLIRELFPPDPSTNGHTKPSSGKLSFVSVGGKFRNQLNDLMTKLGSTGTHFIRCVKPNVHMIPHKFEGSHILSQLRCSGMTSVLELMQQGYPSRTSFVDLYNLYKHHLPPKLSRLEPRMFCRTLFKAFGLNENDYRFGSSKVFFRSGKFAEFDQLMKSDPKHLSELVSKVEKWLTISRWKMLQWCALSVIKLKHKILYRRQMIVTIQKNIRMINARRKYRPRYIAIMRVKKSGDLLKDMSQLTQKLKSSDEKDKFNKRMIEIEKEINDTIQICRTSANLDTKDLESRVNRISGALKEQIESLKSKIVEEEKLRKVQEEMDAERRKKEEEDRRKAEEEELKRKRAELDERFKLEASVKSKEVEDYELAKKLQHELDLELEEQRKRVEQERLDHALALRLAQESSNGVSDDLTRSSPLPASPPHGIKKSATDKKYDLSKWKYSDLRDIINTSCDIELLEACKEEFHRRLKVYHAWKLKNSRNRETSEEERAPDSIMHNPGPIDGLTDGLLNRASCNEQRYFRIPFVRPSSATGQRGWWWAHFDGQWIARQMEIHPEKKPILLVAGKDDMQMCELSLDETRLTSKRGAEILAEEFEKEWSKNGGESVKYHPNAAKKK